MANDDQLARTSDEDPWFVGFWLGGRLARAAWVESEEVAVALAEHLCAPISIRRDEYARHVLDAWQTVQEAKASIEADQQWFADYLAERTDTHPSDG